MCSAQTNVVVECPPGCSDATSLPVYGNNGLFSDLSSICRAAIHAGVLKSGGVVSVSLEHALPAYEGAISNGIKSEPLNTPNTIELRNELKGEVVEGLPSKRRGRVSRSIRIVPVAKASDSCESNTCMLLISSLRVTGLPSRKPSVAFNCLPRAEIPQLPERQTR